MSRLIDRIKPKCQPVRLSLMYSPAELEESFRSFIRKEYWHTPLDDKRLETLVQKRLEGFRRNDPVAKDSFDFRKLANIPVIAGDDVGAYVAALPAGTHMEDIVAGMAPPFNSFFVEFQGVPNAEGLHAWGALVESTDDPTEIEQFEADIGKPRWILYLTSFLEREKGKPFGPVAQHVVGLAEDGSWFRHTDGGVWWGGGPVGLTDEPPEEATQCWGDFLAQYMFPVLLTISFMHCRNVEIRNVVPPDYVARNYLKRHGRELVRYHVLDVQPIRSILDRYRKGTRDDLRRALHICRGHFKTFTPDAPLLGRHVGTYWWGSQVRGSKEEGTVLKDYRVNALREFGKAYHEADENPLNIEKETPASKDPDTVGRGLSAHNRTQNKIAEFLRSFSVEPLSPTRDEPEFDIAWRIGETFYVCEVKSITCINEERQLRMAIGQVIRYRQKLAALGHEPIAAVIAAERQPSDRSWEELCAKEGILLIWPDVAHTHLKELVAGANGGIEGTSIKS